MEEGNERHDEEGPKSQHPRRTKRVTKERALVLGPPGLRGKEIREGGPLTLWKREIRRTSRRAEN